jgi:hypothetical protein
VLLTRRLHLSKGQLVDAEGRLQTRQWDDDGRVRYVKTLSPIAATIGSVQAPPGLVDTGPCPGHLGRSLQNRTEGEAVPKIVVTAAVKDVEAWLKFKPELIAQMSAVASDGTSYVAMDGSNRVASTWDVPDMEAFQAAQTAVSPEMAAAMERYGMIPPVTVYIEK